MKELLEAYTRHARDWWHHYLEYRRRADEYAGKDRDKYLIIAGQNKERAEICLSNARAEKERMQKAVA